MIVEDVVRRVCAIVAPPRAPRAWEPNTIPGSCQFCGDPAVVVISYEDDRVRVRVDHDVPTCPEFVWALENADLGRSAS